MRSDERILKEPVPEVYVGALADSSVNLTLRFWAKNEDFWAAHFHVMETLKYRFDEAGIEIPFPQRDHSYYSKCGGRTFREIASSPRRN